MLVLQCEPQSFEHARRFLASGRVTSTPEGRLALAARHNLEVLSSDCMDRYIFLTPSVFGERYTVEKMKNQPT